MSRLVRAAVAATGVALAVSGCAHLVGGKAVSVFDDPFHVAGMPATDGPSGLRPDAPNPTRQVEHTNGGKDDEVAAQSVSDIEEFWESTYGDPLTGTFKPVDKLISWDSDGLNQVFCRDDTAGVANAGFCTLDNTIGWDRGELVPQLRHNSGDMAVTMVLAHEYGHSIQRQAKLANKRTPTLVAEQQADCFAGVYMRWVAEGNSERFTLTTGEGLNSLLAAMISFRDPLLNEDSLQADDNEHGSAFERISAFQFGFTDGVPACAAIDEKEITQRRADLPVALQQNQTGELAVTERSVRAFAAALDQLFAPANPPQLSFAPTQASACPDARPSSPVSYCPAGNLLVVDLPNLQKMGTKDDSDNHGGLSFGDNTAYSALTSRYMVAVQKERGGVKLDTAEAALRTACLTGVATTKLSGGVTTPDGDTIKLTAGDLDEAVSGILTNGLVAGDVNGESVPSGFSRIDAFRTGVLGNEERCFKRFP